ncbi:MAG: hypothetical protein ACE5JG_11080, partial [Planctomycetota bacterium]
TAAGYGLRRWGIACKTGTAKLGRGRVYHAWMAGFAPHRDGRPPIAFAMAVLDTPESGARECGPRLRRFFSAFYDEAAG